MKVAYRSANTGRSRISSLIDPKEEIRITASYAGICIWVEGLPESMNLTIGSRALRQGLYCCFRPPSRIVLYGGLSASTSIQSREAKLDSVRDSRGTSMGPSTVSHREQEKTDSEDV